MNANATLLWASSKGVGDPRRQPFGVASVDFMVSGAKSLADGSGKSQPLGRDRQEPRGWGAVAVACEQPDRNGTLVSLKLETQGSESTGGSSAPFRDQDPESV